MNTPGGNISRPNRLLQGLVGISLVIHFFLLLYIAKIYKKNELSYIELTLQEVSRPPTRQIPRPRPGPKKIAASTPRLQYPKEIAMEKRPIPHVSSDKVKRFKHSTSPLTCEGISASRYGAPEQVFGTQDIHGIPITEWKPENITREGTPDFTNQNSYFDQVRLLIERHKKYPPSARNRQIEGEATIYFVLSQEGNIIKIELFKPSPYTILNQAALKAVQEAAPFPRPPSHLFNGDISLELTIRFEMVR